MWYDPMVKEMARELERAYPWVFTGTLARDYLTEMIVVIGMTPEQAQREAVLFAQSSGRRQVA